MLNSIFFNLMYFNNLYRNRLRLLWMGRQKVLAMGCENLKYISGPTDWIRARIDDS